MRAGLGNPVVINEKTFIFMESSRENLDKVKATLRMRNKRVALKKKVDILVVSETSMN